MCDVKLSMHTYIGLVYYQVHSQFSCWLCLEKGGGSLKRLACFSLDYCLFCRTYSRDRGGWKLVISLTRGRVRGSN